MASKHVKPPGYSGMQAPSRDVIVAELPALLPRLCLLIGSLLYLNGPFGVTLLKNLPLNNKLLLMKRESAEASRFWNEFRAAWGLWNHVRWLGALGASAALSWRSSKAARPSTPANRITPRPVPSLRPRATSLPAPGWPRTHRGRLSRTALHRH